MSNMQRVTESISGECPMTRFNMPATGYQIIANYNVQYDCNLHYPTYLQMLSRTVFLTRLVSRRLECERKYKRATFP